MNIGPPSCYTMEAKPLDATFQVDELGEIQNGEAHDVLAPSILEE